MPDGGVSSQDLRAMNEGARALILANAIEMRQSIYSNTVTGAISTTNNILNIQPRNVGLIKGFLVEVTAQAVVSTTSSTATLTNFGPSNLLTNIQFTDLNNNNRIQTLGWHLNLINSAKSRRVFGSAVTTDTPIGYGNNYTRIIAASNIATTSAAVTSTLYQMYYVPLAYTDMDLRGAVWANVVNATMNLQLTINPNALIASGDPINAVYTGVAGSLQNVTINVYQNYLDQLPQGKNGVILPPLDLSTVYELKYTNMTGMTVNVDFPIAYPNFRDFLSTIAVFDNNGTFNAGTDVAYWALQSANYTNIWKLDPYAAALYCRQEIGDDVPTGTYYFNHRNKPLATVQYGNLNLVLNASTVNSGASVWVGFEDLALINQVVGAGSIPGG